MNEKECGSLVGITDWTFTTLFFKLFKVQKRIKYINDEKTYTISHNDLPCYK